MATVPPVRGMVAVLTVVHARPGTAWRMTLVRLERGGCDGTSVIYDADRLVSTQPLATARPRSSMRSSVTGESTREAHLPRVGLRGGARDVQRVEAREARLEVHDRDDGGGASARRGCRHQRVTSACRARALRRARACACRHGARP
jgi:hypothetical protein